MFVGLEGGVTMAVRVSAFPAIKLLVAASLGVAASGSAAAPSPTRAAEVELIRLEQAYARALIRKDRAFLMSFYAPEWRGGNWMGFWTKSTMMQSILADRYVVKSMKLRDLSAKVYGDVGIVQGVDEEVTSVNGKNTSGKWAFTDVFHRRNGRWVAVASHTSQIEQKR